MAKSKQKAHKHSGDKCLHANKRPKGRCRFDARASGYCGLHEKAHFPDGWPPAALIEPSPAPNAEAADADFYRSCYTEEELQGVDLKDLAAKQMDAEIRLLRVQLKRVAEQIKQEFEDPNFSLMRPFTTEQEIDDVDVELDADGRPKPIPKRAPKKKGADGADGQRRGTLKRRTTQRAPDLSTRQDSLLGRLVQYIKIREEMDASGGGGAAPDEKARMVRKMQDEIGALMHGQNLEEE